MRQLLITHSNADHIGGNKLIQSRTDCDIYAYGMEKSFTENPVLEPSFLYGGYPFKGLRGKFQLAQESQVKDLEDHLPEGLEFFPLKGHFFDMIGIQTSDGVAFLADSLFSQDTIEKYHLFFIYDVQEYLNTLDFLENLPGTQFIPSHCEAADDIRPLIESNRQKIYEIVSVIEEACQKEATFEEVLKQVFDRYQLTMNASQYVLVGSTIRSYLSWLCDQNKLTYGFEENRTIWKSKD